jgi:hypothetical protein
MDVDIYINTFILVTSLSALILVMLVLFHIQYNVIRIIHMLVIHISNYHKDILVFYPMII